MARRSVQIGLAALSTAIALAVAARLLPRRGAEPFGFVHDPEGEEQLFTESTGSSSNVTGHGPFHVEPIDEATARRLFPMAQDRTAYDPDRYFRHLENQEVRRAWPEHPAGEWISRTNSEGLREDGPASLAASDFGVLVVGDSHTSGACANEETFSGLLEGMLAAERPGDRVEVLNTGCPGYSFYNYLGAVRRYLPDGPDVVAVAVYGGNDFYGVLKMHHFLRGTTYPPRRKTYWDKVQLARERSTSFLAQSLNQVLYFQEHPEQADVALEAALVIAAEIRRQCVEAGARLVFVYIPPMFEVGHPELDDDIRDVRAILGLSEGDLFVARGIRDAFLDGLERLGVEAVDMEPLYQAEEGPCYWARDLHINLLGHELVARALSEHLSRKGGAPAADHAPPDGPYRRLGPGGVLLAEGRFENGLRAGTWIDRYPDGSLRSRGAWRAGRRDGLWEWWYQDGALKKRGHYRDERQVDTWSEWYRSGTLRREGSWGDGRPVGVWREWHESGRLASEGTYEDGLEEGEWTVLHPDGSLKARILYRAGVYHGPAELRHASGALAWRGEHVDGLREGPWEFGREDGTPSARGSFVLGKRQGEWTFWKPGGVIDRRRSGRYEDGERVAAD